MSDHGERDRLTGLYSHRFFRDALARELARDRRHGHPLTLIVLDIDDFKHINDRYGHAAGDSVLSSLASRLRTVVRASDIAGRLGGDEFTLMLPESGLEDAQAFWARCRDELSAKPYESVGPISVSCGIAEFDPNEDATSFLSRADLALHQAKTAGKGEVAVAPPPDLQTLASSRRHSRGHDWQRQPAPPHRRRRWEYWIEQRDPDVERLNDLGAQGWELITTVGGKLIFKRKKRPDQPPPKPDDNRSDSPRPTSPPGPAAA